MEFANNITREDLEQFLNTHYPKFKARIIDFSNTDPKGTALLSVSKSLTKRVKLNIVFDDFYFSFADKKRNKEWREFLYEKYGTEYADKLNEHIDTLIKAEIDRMREFDEKEIKKGIALAEWQVERVKEAIKKAKAELEGLKSSENTEKNLKIEKLEQEKIR